MTAAVFHGSAVRGETRHSVPLSLPRPPLFPDRFAELATGTSTAPRPSHRLKRGLYFPHIPVFSRAQARPAFPPQPGFLAGTSAVSISSRNPAFSRAQARSVFPPSTRLSHGHKRGLYSPRNPAFSREQARSAPRAHVRELLCVSQSSKEQLRRSRTESSAAPPATEELAGEARQVRPARAACGSVSTDF